LKCSNLGYKLANESRYWREAMAQTPQLMSTGDQLAFQQLVTRILSDAAFRAQFEADPDQAG